MILGVAIRVLGRLLVNSLKCLIYLLITFSLIGCSNNSREPISFLFSLDQPLDTKELTSLLIKNKQEKSVKLIFQIKGKESSNCSNLHKLLEVLNIVDNRAQSLMVDDSEVYILCNRGKAGEKINLQSMDFLSLKQKLTSFNTLNYNNDGTVYLLNTDKEEYEDLISNN